MAHTRRTEDVLPLSAVAFEILLTLSEGRAHGYHLMQAIEERTAGAMVLHPGTLYRALARLLEQGVIDEIDAPGADARRRQYNLTAFGRSVAAAEAARLERQVRHARARRLLSER